jgi:1,4-dihydroxy-2-naphthoate octaprenyltransferase
MPTQYVTLKQSEPDFSKYLWGLNEGDKRAVPVRTYNVGTPEECVTFEIKNRDEILRPGFFVFFAAVVKVRSFILILLPLFYVLVKTQMQGTLSDPFGGVLAALACVFLFAGLNIRNDMNDHISGYDRVNLDAALKPIRQGWVTAQQLSKWSLILIGVAGVLAVPVVLMHLELLKVLGLSLFMFFAGRFAKRNSYKHQHFGEIVLFMLAGPALVSGYQISLGAGLDTEALAFGVLWGSAVLFLVQVNNFSHIMTSSQSGITNTMTKLGFDISQKFLMLEWVGMIVAWLLFQAFFGHRILGVPGTVVLVLCSVPLFRALLNIKSPMGSSLQTIRKKAHVAFLALSIDLVAENLVRLWL